jgi:homoserine dehydrogenase
VAALVTVLMDTPLKPDQIEREGILSLEAETIRAARAAGKPYKLVCRAEREGDCIHAAVRPEQVPLGDPLASVNGTSSVIHFELDTLPGLTITEHDPCPETTAYGLLADFINAARHG